jgi:hypothetical protein
VFGRFYAKIQSVRVILVVAHTPEGQFRLGQHGCFAVPDGIPHEELEREKGKEVRKRAEICVFTFGNLGSTFFRLN